MRFLEKSSSSQPLIERAMRGRSANPGSSIKSRVFLALGGAPFSEPWALEFVPYGIRVNTVSPGSILVEGNGWDRYRLANPGYFEDYVRHGFPMGRLGTAEEVEDVIVFIASPRAHWINGRNIPVDGLEQPHAPLDRRPY